MKHIIVILATFLALSGCQPDKDMASLITSENTFEGYPCFENCNNFEVGYTYARTQLILDPNICLQLPQNQQLGCQAYVTDIEVSQLENGGLNLEASSPSN